MAHDTVPPYAAGTDLGGGADKMLAVRCPWSMGLLKTVETGPTRSLTTPGEKITSFMHITSLYSDQVEAEWLDNTHYRASSSETISLWKNGVVCNSMHKNKLYVYFVFLVLCDVLIFLNTCCSGRRYESTDTQH